MPKRKITDDAIDFPAEFQRLADQAEAHLEAVDDLCYQAYVLRGKLLAMHPEVTPWEDEHARLEDLYGYDAMSQAVRCCDYDHELYVETHDVGDVDFSWIL